MFEAHLELFVLESVVFRAFHLGAAGSRIMPELRGTCNSYATCVHIVTRGRPAFSRNIAVAALLTYRFRLHERYVIPPTKETRDERSSSRDPREREEITVSFFDGPTSSIKIAPRRTVFHVGGNGSYETELT